MKIKAVILCASAMSSGLIVEALKEIGAEKGIDIDVECFASLRYKYYDYKGLDAILLAPQVKSQRDMIEKFLDAEGIEVPMDVIDMRNYGLVRGEPIMDQLIKMKEGKK